MGHRPPQIPGPMHGQDSHRGEWIRFPGGFASGGGGRIALGPAATSNSIAGSTGNSERISERISDRISDRISARISNRISFYYFQDKRNSWQNPGWNSWRNPGGKLLCQPGDQKASADRLPRGPGPGPRGRARALAPSPGPRAGRAMVHAPLCWFYVRSPLICCAIFTMFSGREI